MNELRQAAKPFRFVLHARWCPFPKTATCLCGKEHFYSPAARVARGDYPSLEALDAALRKASEEA